jgi:hypothetical protein
MTSIRRFLEQRMRLQVNEEKSDVRKPDDVHFLGFRFRCGNSGKWWKRERAQPDGSRVQMNGPGSSREIEVPQNLSPQRRKPRGSRINLGGHIKLNERV